MNFKQSLMVWKTRFIEGYTVVYLLGQGPTLSTRVLCLFWGFFTLLEHCWWWQILGRREHEKTRNIRLMEDILHQLLNILSHYAYYTFQAVVWDFFHQQISCKAHVEYDSVWSNFPKVGPKNHPKTRCHKPRDICTLCLQGGTILLLACR